MKQYINHIFSEHEDDIQLIIESKPSSKIKSAIAAWEDWAYDLLSTILKENESELRNKKLLVKIQNYYMKHYEKSN